MKRNFLREARKDRGFTMRDVAARVDISPGYYSMIEHGQKTPSGSVAVKLSKLLGVPLERFFENKMFI